MDYRRNTGKKLNINIYAEESILYFAFLCVLLSVPLRCKFNHLQKERDLHNLAGDELEIEILKLNQGLAELKIIAL